MALTQWGFTVSATYALSKAAAPFGPLFIGPDTNTFSHSGINLTTWSQLFAAQYTIAASGTQNIDLSSFTNIVTEATTFAKVLALAFFASGSSATLSPGASNALVWFFGSATDSITIVDGGCFAIGAPITAVGQTVDGSHKNLLITNPGATTLTVTILVLGHP